MCVLQIKKDMYGQGGSGNFRPWHISAHLLRTTLRQSGNMLSNDKCHQLWDSRARALGCASELFQAPSGAVLIRCSIAKQNSEEKPT